MSERETGSGYVHVVDLSGFDMSTIEPMQRADLEDMIPGLALAHGDAAPDAYKDMYRMCDLARRQPDYARDLGVALKLNDGSFERLYDSGFEDREALWDLAGKYPDFMDPVTRYAVDVINDRVQEASAEELGAELDTELDDDAELRRAVAEENEYLARNEAYENALYWNPEDRPAIMRAYAEWDDTKVLDDASEMELMRTIAEDYSFEGMSVLDTLGDVRDVLDSAGRSRSPRMPEWLSQGQAGPGVAERSSEYLMKMRVLWDYSCKYPDYAVTLDNYVSDAASAIYEAEHPDAWKDELDAELAREASEGAVRDESDLAGGPDVDDTERGMPDWRLDVRPEDVMPPEFFEPDDSYAGPDAQTAYALTYGEPSGPATTFDFPEPPAFFEPDGFTPDGLMEADAASAVGRLDMSESFDVTEPAGPGANPVESSPHKSVRRNPAQHYVGDMELSGGNDEASRSVGF